MISWEYLIDTAELLRPHGKKIVLVTNGCVSDDVLDLLLPYVDAMNIDLKGDAVFYQELGGSDEMVRHTIERCGNSHNFFHMDEAWKANYSEIRKGLQNHNMKKFQAKLQTFAGAMMVPIILLVLVGFFVGIGAAFTNYILPEGTFLYKIFSMLTNLGFMFMNNLGLWYAVALSFTLAKKEKGWAAFAGLIMFYCYMRGIEGWAAMNGYTAETVAVDALMAKGYTEQQALNFNALWGTNIGMFGYNMGIFSGLISGVVTAAIHNKYVDKTLPDMFAFFQGTKYVIIMVSLWSVVLSIGTYYIWPFIGKGLQSITNVITASGLFGTFLFGTLDKMLLPFGLHHLIAFPIEYSRVGGTMEIDGVVYEGVKNIINGQAASASATGYITRNFTNGRLLFQLAGIPGAAYAMYKCADPENRKQVKALMLPAVFTLAMVGISEPFEYTFLFVAP